MQLGMVGLGRMGANMVRRLVRDGHELVVFDVSADAVNSLAHETGATGASSLEDMVVQAAAAAGDLDNGPGRLHRRDDQQARRPRIQGRRADRRRQQLLPR